MFLDKAKELCDQCKEVSEEIETRVSTKLHNLYNSTEVDGDEVVNFLEDIEVQIGKLDDDLFNINCNLHSEYERQIDYRKAMHEYILAVDFLVGNLELMIEDEEYNEENLNKRLRIVEKFKMKLEDTLCS